MYPSHRSIKPNRRASRPPRRKFAANSLGLAAAWLLTLGMAACAQGDGWQPDVFATETTVADSPAQAAADGTGSDPCLTPARHVGQTWTLPDVIDRALCHNPQTRQTWANARYQAAQVGVATAAYLPTLNLSGSISHGRNSAGSNLQNPIQTFQGGSGQGGSSGNGAQPSTRWTPALSFNYLLFDFGGRAAKLDGARLALEAANWNHAAALQSVLFAAIQAYYQWFATQQALAAAETAEKSSAAAFAAAKFRHQVGAAALADPLQAQSAYAQAQLNRQKADGDAHIAAGALANVLGLDADVALNIAAPPLTEPDEHWEKNVHALIEAAKRSRPELAAAEAQVQAAEAGVRTAKAGSLPSVALVGNYAYNDSGLSDTGQGSRAMGSLRQFDSWNVGLQLSVPLFTGFANTYQIRSAQEQVAVQTANRDKLGLSVALEVWSAYHNLNTVRATLRSSGDWLASAGQSEQVAMGRYKAGAGSVLDLLNAQASLAGARFQQVKARYDWYIGKARLAQALGQLEPG